MCVSVCKVLGTGHSTQKACVLGAVGAGDLLIPSLHLRVDTSQNLSCWKPSPSSGFESEGSA